MPRTFRTQSNAGWPRPMASMAAGLLATGLALVGCGRSGTPPAAKPVSSAPPAAASRLEFPNSTQPAKPRTESIGIQAATSAVMQAVANTSIPSQTERAAYVNPVAAPVQAYPAAPMPQQVVPAAPVPMAYVPMQPHGMMPQPMQYVPAVSEAEIQPLVRKASLHFEQGVSLASRNALFSARAEFFDALRLCVQVRDMQLGHSGASVALAAALKALDEAKDFVPRPGQLEDAIDLHHLARNHETPVLRTPGNQHLRPSTAREAYGAYAEQQLHAAVGSLPVASSVLHALGKVHSLVDEQGTNGIHDARFKAVVLHRAALRVQPANFMAANDLAVLLAREGSLEQARALLVHSVRTSPQLTAWQNLATVHRRLGETQLAELALLESQKLSQAAANGQAAVLPQFPIQWVDPHTFAATSVPPADLQRGQRMPANVPAAVPAAAGERRGVSWVERLPWNQTRR